MRTLLTSLLVAACVAVVALLLFDTDADATPRAPAPPPAVVGVAAAVAAEFAPQRWSPGSIVSRRDARVAGEEDGRVLRVVEIGQTVRAGEALVVLDDGALRLREDEQRAALGRIEAQLALANLQEARYGQLVSRRDVARAQYDQVRADRDVLAQELARARAQLQQIRHQRARMTVRAPFDGVVAERLVQLGEYLPAGGAVARLVDTAMPEIRARAPVSLARHLAPGTEVQVRFDTGVRSFPIAALVPVGDEASRQLELRIAIDDRGPPVGSAVEVGLPNAEARRVIAVPRDAVVLRGDGRYVLRVGDDDRAERLAVRTGTELDGLVEVLDGAVRPGDRLVVRGGERVDAGQAVVVQTTPAAAGA